MHNSEAADSQEVPKNRPTFWAVSTHHTGNECPLLVLSMPDTCKRLRVYTLHNSKKAVTAD